ncbi:MAG: TRAP transporter substrate-binding protein DctP [Spirochaetaceae bacterium]|jgi:TRAP-type C4-dicarboxylate transport system substrate-binding protein|nr:TRAP transporter substrate-binding protein DctP [Spirochaetaceae bacterium]
MKEKNIPRIERSFWERRCRGGLFAVLFLLAAPGALFAQRTITLKLASMAPENTPWGAALNRIAAEWSAISKGEVELRVYHNGVAGGEADVLRKLKLNQIQGVVLTSAGLNLIDPQIMTLSTPFLIRNDAELDRVLRDLQPLLEENINKQGFFTLAWAKSGWVKIFSRREVFVPQDLKRQKLGLSPETPELGQAFKVMGYQMVPTMLQDTLSALNSGMIDAVCQSPALVGGMQVFGIAKHMASINIAPFMGSIVLNKRAWDRVPEAYKPRIAAASRRIANEMGASITQMEAEVIRTMTGLGLKVNQLSPDQEQAWYTDVEGAMPNLLESTFNRELYQKITSILQQYRSGR